MSGKRILVVEDEQIVAMDIAGRLTDMGYAVAGTAATGEAAIQRALETRPDLALMDIRLRGEMDGVEAAKQIQAQLDIPVIYLTAYADEETLERAKITQAFGYILKPFEERDLRISIEMALYKHKAESDLRTYASKLERANQQLTLSNRVVSAAANDFEPQATLTIACRHLSGLLNLPHVVAARINVAQGTVETVAEYKVNGRPSALQRVFPIQGQSVFQHLFTNRRPLLVNDAQTDPLTAPYHALLRRNGISSLLLLPFVSEGDVVGGLGLCAADRHFSDEDIRLASNTADQLASALARAELNEERKRLTAAIQQTDDSVIITDANAHIVYVNPAFERVSGYSPMSLSFGP